ncbi:MAG TPA: transposase [Lacipirellulaceae bacterium]|nr:transposase [Lacipirellulaceae bacterium]
MILHDVPKCLGAILGGSDLAMIVGGRPAPTAAPPLAVPWRVWRARRQLRQGSATCDFTDWAGVEISRKTMGDWLAQCAKLLDPLYQLMKKKPFGSKVIDTDDTSVKVLDRKLPFARIGRIWPYAGNARHPVIVYDYTPTSGRAGPAKFLEGYIKDTCKRTPTQFSTHFSKPNPA